MPQALVISPFALAAKLIHDGEIRFARVKARADFAWVLSTQTCCLVKQYYDKKAIEMGDKA